MNVFFALAVFVPVLLAHKACASIRGAVTLSEAAAAKIRRYPPQYKESRLLGSSRPNKPLSLFKTESHQIKHKLSQDQYFSNRENHFPLYYSAPWTDPHQAAHPNLPTASAGHPVRAIHNPTYEMFCAAVSAYHLTTAGGHPPKPSHKVYDSYIRHLPKNMCIEEQAMFLANTIWETSGFQFIEEIACKGGGCATGMYYGRGYIQLTWDYNYREASYSIYGDDRLLRDPSLVATVEGAWMTAFWFWTHKVTPVLAKADAVRSRSLGYSILVINGFLECNDSSSMTPKNRLVIYNAILKLWGIAQGSPGRITGCANQESEPAYWRQNAHQADGYLNSWY